MSRTIRFLILSGIAVFGLILAACGPIPPGLSVHIAPDGQSAQISFSGRVDSIGNGGWVIDGHSIQVDSQTAIVGSILAGDTVHVDATATANGAVTASRIALVTSSAGANSPSAKGDQPFDLGTAFPTFSGTFSDMDSGTPEPKPTEETTEEATGGNDNNQHETGNHTGEIELTGSVGSIAADQWVISGLAFAIDASTKIDGTFSVGDMVHVHALVGTNGAFTAVEIGPVDKNAAGHGEIQFTGTVGATGPSQWTIDGLTVLVTDKTRINGATAVGDTVHVIASVDANGGITALIIQGREGEGFEFQPTLDGDVQIETPDFPHFFGGEKNPYDGQFPQGTPEPFHHH